MIYYRTIGFVACCLFFLGGVNAQGRDEFNGPFASWANVKDRFGARGNGKDDDSKAFQQAIDQLSNPVTGANMTKDRYMVIYVPAGTYCISATLEMKGKIGVSIIGEDPSRTVIKWIGADGKAMFLANASSYFKIARLCWDANGRKKMEGVGIHWKEIWKNATGQSFAPLNIEISDNIFTGAFDKGISGGTYAGEGTGNNDSEVTIRRCTFYNCTYSGIDIHGYNALDYWIWDCRFLRCSTGIACAHGNFHAYRCYFSALTSFDLAINNCYYTSVRGCFFQNGYGLAFDGGVSCNPFKRIYVDNTVVNLRRYPIEYYHIGKITLMDNRIGKVRDTADYVVNTGSFDWCYAIYEILSVNNRYESKQPFHSKFTMKNYVVNDQQVDKVTGDSSAFLASMDKMPPRVDRPRMEVPEDAAADEIQSVIDRAATLNGQRPVIHFGPGTHQLDKPLNIPAGSDMQLIGDGLLYASVIQKKDQKSILHLPMIHVNGPSFITIRDLQIGSEGDQTQFAAISFTNVDQPRSEAHLDQIYSSQADTSLFVDGMDYLYLQKDNSFFTTGNYVSGGPMMQQGKGTAKVNCFGGQFARLSVQKNAHFLARDCWWEGSDRIPLNLTGSGYVTIDGAMIAPSGVDSTPTFKINKFLGNITLMNMYLQGSLWVQSDNPALNLLVWNVHFYHKMNVLEFLNNTANYKGAFLGLNAQCFPDTILACHTILSIVDRTANIQNVGTFIDNLTKEDRDNKPRIFRNLDNGVSNIYVSRVSLGAVRRGIVFQ